MWTFLSSSEPNPVSCWLNAVLDCKRLTAKTQETDVKIASVLRKTRCSIRLLKQSVKLDGSLTCIHTNSLSHPTGACLPCNGYLSPL